MILYKYRSDSKYTEAIFSDRKVWLSTASQLNDPFECSIQEIAAEWIDKRVEEGMQAAMAGFALMAIRSIESRKGFYGLSPKQTKDLIDRIGKHKNLEPAYNEMRKFVKSKTGMFPKDLRATFRDIDKQLNNVGIFSLSSNPSQQLMWAHYADQSRGLAIGFETTAGSKLSNPRHCLKVTYSNNLPAFSGDGLIVESSFTIGSHGMNHNRTISFNDPTFRSAVSTKSESWSYEEEWRYVEESAGSYDHPGPLKEIIFGLNCRNEIIGKYLRLSNLHIPHSVSFKKIAKVDNTNQIQLTPMTEDEIQSYSASA